MSSDSPNPRKLSKALRWQVTSIEATPTYYAFAYTVYRRSGYAVRLGCSRDDVVTDPSSPDTTGLAEYKCPYSLKGQSVDQLLATKATSHFCLSRGMDGHLRLKRSHVYYYQVQGQLAITKLPWCDFVVCELHIERVRVDPSFWSEVVVKLVSFYDIALLPELASPCFPRGQSIREPTELQFDSDWLDATD